MQNVRNILVIVDPTAEAQPAVAKAARLAEKSGARLELYICDTRAAREMRLVAERARDPSRLLNVNLKPYLESLAQPIRQRGVDVATETDYADQLHDGLLAHIQSARADLVVKDTHHHSLMKRTFITNTDWHLIRSCAVPLLLAKPGDWHEPPTLIAAVDPGHANDKPEALDQRILAQASSLAQTLGGALHAAHCYIPMAIVAAATGAPPMVLDVSQEALQVEDEAKRTQMQALVRDYPVAARNIHIEAGGPAEFLPRIAETLGADVIVMGAISRSGLKRVLIGSTAERILERLPCDLLIVKPPGFSAALAV